MVGSRIKRCRRARTAEAVSPSSVCAAYASVSGTRCALFQLAHQSIEAFQRVRQPIPAAPRRGRRESNEHTIADHETTNSNALDIAPPEAMHAAVGRERDALRVDHDTTRKMKGHQAPRDGRR